MAAKVSEMPILADFGRFGQILADFCRFGHYSAAPGGTNGLHGAPVAALTIAFCIIFCEEAVYGSESLCNADLGRFWPILTDLGIIQRSPGATNGLHGAPVAALTIAFCIIFCEEAFYGSESF